jgi:hypothetical protein
VKKKQTTSASELAEMGYCEKRMLFEHRLGPRASPAREKARLEGLVAHQAFHRDAVTIAPDVQSSEVKPWCFIASELFGQGAWETDALRMARDRLLRRCAAGRAFIAVYYRYSPGLARWLRHHRRVRTVARMLLRPVAVAFKWHFDWHSRASGVEP